MLVPDPDGTDIAYQAPKWMHTQIGGLHFAFVTDEWGVIVEGDEATQTFVGVHINSAVVYLKNLYKHDKRAIVYDAAYLN